ncbi:hypothetical protein AgCh_030112 [Apium graveolens]
MQTITLQQPDENWYLDTGASSYMTSNSGNLSSYSNLSNHGKVLVGNGSEIPIIGLGTKRLTPPLPPLLLKNVLHAPHLIKNLVSVRQLTTYNNVSVEFDRYGFTVKDMQTGMPLLRQRHKARLVVDGRSQQVGIDCGETFSPQPPGFRDRQHPDYVCLLRKSIYGLRQSPRDWYKRFDQFISTIGFIHSTCDNSLFIYTNGADTAYILLYVDDIILTASSPALRDTTIASLRSEFPMTDLGPLNYFLGVSAICHSNGLFLHQSKYASDIIARAKMTNCKPAQTPVDTKSKLSANSGEKFDDPTLYRSLDGALQYLTFTRPNISYAVQQVCLYMHDPRTSHYAALKRIIRYIQGDNLISWSAKRQATLSRSSAEAEYHGVANVVAESCWLRNLLHELHCPIKKATIVYCDNVSAIYLSGNPVHHQRTKHIEMDIHFVHEKVALGQWKRNREAGKIFPIDMDLVHRQTAPSAVKHMALGVAGLGCEDALVYLMNHVWPNIFETSPHVINAVIEAMRVALGAAVVLNYYLEGLFHLARKVREVYWKLYNSLYIGAQDAMVAAYPSLYDEERNIYSRTELTMFV